MCGIAGVFYYQEAGPDADRRLAERKALSSLEHRGPDAEGVFVDRYVSLLHRRLSIIDLKAGDQPLYSQDKKVVLVANGEIYNYLELRNELRRMGYSFSTGSDCETLVNGYQAYGDGFVDRLHGMFAFGLYDAGRRRLLLGRDRLGIKPLYYCETPSAFYFASEIKAVLALSGISPGVDLGALGEFLQVNYVSGDKTAFQKVRKVLPGTVIEVSGQGARARRYWALTDIRPRTIGFAAAGEEFSALAKTVIPVHLRSDVPVGIFLSGGLDSSVLSALCSRHDDRLLRSFSVGFPGSSVHDELRFARRIAHRLGIRHHVLELRRGQLLEHLVRSVWAADDLMGDYANLPTAMLAEEASSELKVIFSGEGGDEVFAGYSRYRPRRIRGFFSLFRAERVGGYAIKTMLSRGGAVGCFSEDLRRRLKPWIETARERWGGYPTDWSPLMKRQAFDIETWLPNDLLVKADRMTMLYGLEGRVPLLDHRIVEFGLGLPDALKVNRRTGKLFLKRWAEAFLPRDHIWTKKRGFTVPVRDWLRGPFLQRLYQRLSEERDLADYLDMRKVRAIVNQQNTTGRYAALLWALLQFAIWHKLYIRGHFTRGMPEKMHPLDFLAS